MENTAVQTAQEQAVQTAIKADRGLKSILATQSVKARFAELLGKKAPGFISSILSLVNNNKLLAKADPNSVLNSAVIAATLDLPINPNLGFASIVPYGSEAQFQMQYKGFIQLAMRSGQYLKITTNEVYEGEIKSFNRFTGDYVFGDRTSDKVIGYMAYFRMVNGFEQYYYMSVEEVKAHGLKYSQSFKKGYGVWKDNFDAMAKKTVLKLLLSKFGILSIEMQQSLTFDQATIQGNVIEEHSDINDIAPTYVDNETGEIMVEEQKQGKDNEMKTRLADMIKTAKSVDSTKIKEEGKNE